MKKPVSLSLFGENKTWRGLIFGVLCGTAIAFLQFNFFIPEISIFDYESQGLKNSLYLGFLQSSGILFFDILKSFFKRLRKKPPGSSWIPFDQLDYLGGLVFSFLIFIPESKYILTILIAGPFVHAIFNLLGYIFKIKKVYW